MIIIIGINIITGIILILYGNKIGERGGENIINRIITINISIIFYYIYRILILGEERRITIGKWLRDIEKEIEYYYLIDCY